MGVVSPPPEVVGRLEALLAADQRDELLAVFLGEVAGVSPQQIGLMRSLPAWEARLAAAHTIPRELRAEREYAFDPTRARRLAVPTLLLQGGDSPAAFARAVEMLHASLPDSRVVVMPGQGHVAMDTGTELFVAEVTRFVEATR